MTRAVTALVAVLASYFAGYFAAWTREQESRALALQATLMAEQCSTKIHELNNACQIWREFAEKGLRK